MSGVKFLLDTNYILGLLKSQPAVLEELALRKIGISECAYSAITRIELLGFQEIRVVDTAEIGAAYLPSLVACHRGCDHQLAPDS